MLAWWSLKLKARLEISGDSTPIRLRFLSELSAYCYCLLESKVQVGKTELGHRMDLASNHPLSDCKAEVGPEKEKCSRQLIIQIVPKKHSAVPAAKLNDYFCFQ